MHGIHRDERGQSLVIVLALITLLFLVGSAMAAHATVALRAAAAGGEQAGEFHAADAGTELGIWWQRNGRSGNPPPISVNGATVTTTIGLAGGSACATPTPIRITGFESGAVSASGTGLFSAVVGNQVTAVSSVARSGGWSLRIDDPNGSRHNATIPAVGGTVVARLYLRLEALPSADVTELLILDAVAGNDLRLGYQAASRRLTLRFGSLATTVAGTTIAAGTWVRLDLRVTADTNPRTADWQVDGIDQASISSAGAASSVRSIRPGSNVNADVYVVNFDDLMASATASDYPIGDGSVEALRPDGMGTSVSPGSFSHDDGSPIDATTFTRLADDPMTSTGDYLRQTVAGAASYVETTFSNTTATCIAGVAGMVEYRSASATANNGRTRIFDGGSENVVFSGDMSETAQFYRSAILTRAGGWTTASVNGLLGRFGYSTDVSPIPYWHALLLEVARGTGAPDTVTVTASSGGSTVVTTYTDAGAAAPALLTWTASR